MNFASDGVAYCAPEIFARIVADNPVTTPVFDTDEITAALKLRVQDVFEAEVDIFTVATGSASNSLALAALTPPYGAILSHVEAHIQTDECGAPEMITGGAKLIGLPGEHGKIASSTLADALKHSRFGFTHAVQPHVLSLSQLTEAGTIYTPKEVAELCETAKQYGVRVHVDGARFANAVAALSCSPADLSWRAGVSILSLGATKNGAIAAEVIIVFDRSVSERLRFMRKRSGHLIAKNRLLALQLDTYLTEDLWLRNARHANEHARRLEEVLTRSPDIRLVHPRQANELFLEMPDELLHRLTHSGVKLYENWRTFPLRHHRMVTSFATTQKDVDGVASILGV